MKLKLLCLLVFLLYFSTALIFAADVDEFKKNFLAHRYLSGSFSGKTSDGEKITGKFFLFADRFRFEVVSENGLQYLFFDGENLISYAEGAKSALKTKFNGANFYFPDSILSYGERVFNLFVSKGAKGYNIKCVAKEQSQVGYIDSVRVSFSLAGLPNYAIIYWGDGRRYELKFERVSSARIDDSLFEFPFQVPILDEEQ